MPRRARKDFKSCYYHIMVQGIHREEIFQRSEFKDKYLNLVFRYLIPYNISVLAYCVMANHAHFLVSCEEAQLLSDGMKRVNISYARYYNQSTQRVGYVFRSRFKSEQIRDQKHLYSCFSYIHRNPLKAKMVQEFGVYKWSSDYEILTDQFVFLAKEEIDSALGYVSGSLRQHFKDLHTRNYEDIWIENDE